MECDFFILYGILLSGGIYSSVIAYLASQATRVIGFSIEVESCRKNKDVFWAQTVAQKVGIPCHFISIPEDIHDIAQWINLVYLCETPYVGPEQIYKYPVYRYIQSNFPAIKVVLSGQGSDEFNGGYSTQFGGFDSDGWQNFFMILDHMKHNTKHWHSSMVVKWWNMFYDRIAEEIVRSEQIQPLDHNNGIIIDHQDTWVCYIKNKARDLQMYNLWQEDRLAAGVGLENRVPFLNDLVLEVVLNVPIELGDKLFWDKLILRKAFQKELGITIAHRPKVPLFYGKGQNSTIQMMIKLISMNHFELVKFAFPLDTWLNKANLIACIKQIADKPPYKGWEKIVRLVNIGILEQMHCNIGKNVKKFNHRIIQLKPAMK